MRGQIYIGIKCKSSKIFFSETNKQGNLQIFTRRINNFRLCKFNSLKSQSSGVVWGYIGDPIIQRKTFWSFTIVLNWNAEIIYGSTYVQVFWHNADSFKFRFLVQEIWRTQCPFTGWRKFFFYLLNFAVIFD